MAKQKDDVTLRCLSWKEIGAIISLISLLSGAVTTVIAWLHAEVLVPRILRQTEQQIEKELAAHSEHPHAVSVSKEEMQRHESAIRKDVKSVEGKIDEFKADTKKRFDRIEDKLDRM